MDTKWLLHRRPNPDCRIRLFCFPFAGGSATVYRLWVARLGPEIEVCPVQLPGRANRFNEPPLRRLADLVSALERELSPLLDKPFAFFGHSMGAMLAFELARALRQRHGVEPAHLFVSARQAPVLPEQRPPVHALPDSAFIAELRQLQGTPAELLASPDLLALYLPVLRADFEVVETYTYAPGLPLETPITAFAGSRDPHTSLSVVEQWSTLTRGSFSVLVCDGDHFFIQSHEGFLLRSIASALARPAASPSSRFGA